MNVVIATKNGAESRLVDEIGDVLEMDGDLCELPTSNLPAAARMLIDGVTSWGTN
jgi:hypothetical protein